MSTNTTPYAEQGRKAGERENGAGQKTYPCLGAGYSACASASVGNEIPGRGLAEMEPKKLPGNPLSRYERHKELTYMEQLQFQIALLKRELAEEE